MTLGLSRPEREVLMEASLVGLWRLFKLEGAGHPRIG